MLGRKTACWLGLDVHATLTTIAGGGGIGCRAAVYYVPVILLRSRFLEDRCGGRRVLEPRFFRFWHSAIRCTGDLAFGRSSLDCPLDGTG